MPKGYWIAQMDVTDPDTYDRYRAANAKPRADFGARFLVRGGQQEIREGTGHSRTVILEFPSYADAIACNESPQYQQAKDLRVNAAVCDLMIVEGYDG